MNPPLPPDRLLGTPTLAPATFTAHEPDPSVEILLHLNTLTDNDRADFERWIMQRDAVTGTHTLTLPLPADGAFSYRFARGNPLDRAAGATREGWRQIHGAGQPDPANPERLRNPLGEESSVWRGPSAPQAPQGDGVAAWHPFTITHVDGRSRTVWRLPATAPRTARLVLFDGNMWATEPLARAFATHFPGVEVLAVDALSFFDREADLTSLAAAESLLTDVLARADGEPPLILAGQSFGGLAAATLAIHRPALVAAAIAQSGSYWYRADAADRDVSQPGDLIDHASRAELSPAVRLLLQVGTEELHLRPLSAQLRDAARAGGASVGYTEYRGGHDYAWWHPALFDALKQLLA